MASIKIPENEFKDRFGINKDIHFVRMNRDREIEIGLKHEP
jgi:hypothetical protein